MKHCVAVTDEKTRRFSLQDYGCMYMCTEERNTLVGSCST